MKKSALLATLLLSGATLATTIGGTVAFAAEGGTTQSKGTVSFVAGVTQPPTIVDPGNPPEIIDPIKPPTGQSGPLSIDFASDLMFGEQEISSNDKTYYAHPTGFDTDGDKSTIEDYTVDFVQVSDLRGSFAGWTLSVAQDAQFHLPGVTTSEATANVGDYLTGATLNFSGGHVVAGTVSTPEVNAAKPSQVKGDSFAVSSAATTVVGAKVNEGMGKWSYAFGQKSDYDAISGDVAAADKSVAKKSPITLQVPGSTAKKAGVYETTLTWTLSDTPAV
ncbi:MAG: WxL domain-containing protein [Streptococcaceae bacterium]|jgi:hypothetical protein|nr:WxL domain-containing protein [Streptococcaceae bacterium]